MARRWPKDIVFTRLLLEVEDLSCGVCGRRMHACDHRHHRIYTFRGPLHLVCKLVRCPERSCPHHHRTFSPGSELTLTMPRWMIGWDVFCWLGHRRMARHWSVPQIRAELMDSYQIPLSEDAIEDYLQRYQCMLAARQQDPVVLRQEYRRTRSLKLSIDGLQPEKGHETLYVVRELNRKRVWFAQPLLSSSTAEVRALIVKARDWAGRLGKPVRLWMSDKQDAFVTTIASEFPGVPHRYCANHFLRDLAKPVLALDSQAKVQMRRKIRGLRAIERRILDQRRVESQSQPTSPGKRSRQAVRETEQVVLDYCAAVRGILNDSQGGPLHPPGLRMSKALTEVRRSLARNIGLKKGGMRKNSWSDWCDVSIEESTWSGSHRTRCVIT